MYLLIKESDKNEFILSDMDEKFKHSESARSTAIRKLRVVKEDFSGGLMIKRTKSYLKNKNSQLRQEAV